MRKKKLLKAGIVAASFAAMVPVATQKAFEMDVFAEETDETSVVAEAGTDDEEGTGDDVAAPAAEADAVDEENLSDSPSFAPEEKSGWVEEEGGWRYYYGSGEYDYYRAGVFEINKKYYAFLLNGLMLDNDDMSFWSDELGRTVYVRAKEGGLLYRGEWYQAGDSWYYYTSDCYSASGVVTVNKKQYLFENNGYLLKSNLRKGDDGYYYASDEDGIATRLPETDGWAQAGGKYYYIQDGAPVKNTVIKIGSAWYGFNYYGIMRTDQSFTVYDDDAGKTIYYRAKANGKLYCNEWFRQNEYDRWHYYGADARSVEGVVTVGKKTYIFYYWDGGMFTSQTTIYDGTPYIIDKDGVATVAKEGWNKSGNSYYYLKDGEFLEDVVEKIGSEYYGFGYEGVMYDNETFEIDGKYYRAKEGGALYKNAWYFNYYYHSDASAGEGLETIAKKQYYFVNGKAVQGEFFLIDGELYHADSKCVVAKVTKDGFYYHDANRESISFVSGGKVLRDAWKKSGGKYYYFDENGFAVVGGRREINGKYYLFDHDGAMASAGWKMGNQVYVTGSGALATGDQKINGVWYYFDEYGDKRTGLVETETGLFLYGPDGAYIGKATGSGWNQIKGTYYYVHSDGSVAVGLKTIGKAEYYFDYDGTMKKDTTVYLDGGQVLLKANGQRLTNGWYQMNGEWFYAEDGKLASGDFATIAGKEYYFNWYGAMATSDFIYGDKLVKVGANGVITSKNQLANGWTLAGGNYHYMKNGSRYTGWVGDYYFEGGEMYRNQVADGYWVQYDGKYQKTQGWAIAGVPGDSWETGCYIKKGGKLAKDEWLQIGGKWYYFSGYYRVGGLREIDGVWYIFNDNGTMQTTIGKNLPDGWVKAGDQYYYFASGDIVEGDLEINGKIYSFDYSHMVTNNFNGSYTHENTYFSDANGYAKTTYKGWVQVHGNWFYFGENNKTSLYAWTTQGTAQYFTDYGMVTGTRVINGHLYTFNANGVLTKEHSLQNGWYTYEGEYYYFQNGRAVTQKIVTDKGKSYLFGWDGKMVKNETSWAYNTSVGGGTYYADANGVIVKNAWKKVNGRDRYFDDKGRMLSGIQKINGKVYYFS